MADVERTRARSIELRNKPPRQPLQFIPPPRSTGGRTAKATDGFQSKREAKRWGELRLLELAGDISQLRNNRDHKAECTFELLPAQHIDGHCVERAIKYICDFRYINRHGFLIVEDVKGYRESIYRLKRKLMLHVHKIQVHEV